MIENEKKNIEDVMLKIKNGESLTKEESERFKKHELKGVLKYGSMFLGVLFVGFIFFSIVSSNSEDDYEPEYTEDEKFEMELRSEAHKLQLRREAGLE